MGNQWCGGDWSGLSTEETCWASLCAQEGSAGEMFAALEVHEAKGQREFGQIGGRPCEKAGRWQWARHDFPLRVADVERVGISCWW